MIKESRHSIAIYALFAILGIALYYPALQGAFIMDDWFLISQNLTLTRSASPWGFWTNFEQFDYWPLTYTLFWTIWKLFPGNVLAFHTINVLIHALNASLLFVISKRFKVPWAFGAALLFLVHPLNMEAVAWMIQLKTLAATSFCLLSLIFYARYKSNLIQTDLILSLVLFALGLLSKTSIALFPVFLITVEVLVRKRVNAKILFPASGFLFISILASCATLALNSKNTSDHHMIVWNSGLLERVLAASQHFWFYIAQFFWPAKLSHFYPINIPNRAEFTSYIPILLLGVGAAALIRMVKRNSKTGLSALIYLSWYILHLVPVLGLVDIPYMKLSLVADHWTYLANLGLCLAMAHLGFLGFEHVRNATLINPIARKISSGFVCVLFMGLLGSLSFETWQHSKTFQTEEGVWNDVLSKFPNSATAHYNLGVSYYGRQLLDSAAIEFEAAHLSDPKHARAIYNLGVIYFDQGKLDLAEKLILEAAQADPQIALIYTSLAAIYTEQKRQEPALQIVEQGIHSVPASLSSELYKKHCEMLGFKSQIELRCCKRLM